MAPQGDRRSPPKRRPSEIVSAVKRLSHARSDTSHHLPDFGSAVPEQRPSKQEEEIAENSSPDPQGTVFSTVANVVKNVIGSGLLSVPLAFYTAQPTVAIVLILFQVFSKILFATHDPT